ncbi:MAG: transposase [Nitrososphaerales archaeon]|nr:transposase [Nitrososphaerales archaeon]
MLTTYRFRLYPTKTQEHLMNETLETCRLLFNNMLADKKENGTGFYEQKKAIASMKPCNKFLKAVHSQVLQDVALRLDKAYQAFFVGLAKRPMFKRKGKYNAFRYPQLGGFRVIGNRLRLSKIDSIKMKVHGPIGGTPKTCTILRDADQWYACISAEMGNHKPMERVVGKPIGVDLGITNLATLSDGIVFPNPRYLRDSTQRITHLQKSLSRKRLGSNNRLKTKMALAKAWRKVRNRRGDTAHKVSRQLANNYSTIVFEDLHIPSMVKNHYLASAIMDASWGQLRRLTAYKAERRGGRVILVEPSGTSQKCSGCGEVVPKELSERVHRCPRCGLSLDRDVNAARNILKLGLERARAEEQPLLVQRRRISKFAPMKQEAQEFVLG